MDKKIYVSPNISIISFSSEDVITTSSLTFGGENGKSISESFNSLFGK